MAKGAFAKPVAAGPAAAGWLPWLGVALWGLAAGQWALRQRRGWQEGRGVRIEGVDTVPDGDADVGHVEHGPPLEVELRQPAGGRGMARSLGRSMGLGSHRREIGRAHV